MEIYTEYKYILIYIGLKDNIQHIVEGFKYIPFQLFTE
jgi:hypothetical protein